MVEKAAISHLQVIWDYMCLGQPLQKADCIVGFGTYNIQIAYRAAELYLQGYAPKILFSGGLGRNTLGIMAEPEAVRFARAAMERGVPETDILIEDRSTNTSENILFTRKILEEQGIPHDRLLCIHQPFMERRVMAALGVYWPDGDFSFTSPVMDIPKFFADAAKQGIDSHTAVEIVVGDFQRMDLYAKLGYQIPQEIPQPVWDAFHALVAMGYDGQLAKG